MQFGADDVGSILIEENVVYAAGVRNRTNEAELRRIISDAGYIPAQRDTLYRSYSLKPRRSLPLRRQRAASTAGDLRISAKITRKESRRVR